MTFISSFAVHVRRVDSWVRPDMADQAGMTFMTIDFPTGYVVNRDTIQNMYMQGVPGLRRVQFRDRTLVMFFEFVRDVTKK